MAAEYSEKIELGRTFYPGKIHGEMVERPPAAPEPLEVSCLPARKNDYAFLSCVLDRLTSWCQTCLPGTPRRYNPRKSSAE